MIIKKQNRFLHILPFLVFLATIGIGFAALATAFADFCADESKCARNLYIPNTPGLSKQVPKAYDAVPFRISPKYWVAEETKKSGEPAYCVGGTCVSDISDPKVIITDRVVPTSGETADVSIYFFILGNANKYHTLYAEDSREGSPTLPTDRDGKPLERCACDTRDDETDNICMDWTLYENATADPNDCYRDYDKRVGEEDKTETIYQIYRISANPTRTVFYNETYAGKRCTNRYGNNCYYYLFQDTQEVLTAFRSNQVKCPCDSSPTNKDECQNWEFERVASNQDILECYDTGERTVSVPKYQKRYNRVTKVPQFHINQLKGPLAIDKNQPSTSLYDNYLITSGNTVLNPPQLITNRIDYEIIPQTSSDCFTGWDGRPSKVSKDISEFRIITKGVQKPDRKVGSVAPQSVENTWCRIQVFSPLGRPVSYFYQQGTVRLLPVSIPRFIAKSVEQSGETISILENEPFSLEWETTAAKQLSLEGENIDSNDNYQINYNKVFNGSMTLSGISLSGISKALPWAYPYEYALTATNDKKVNNSSTKKVSVRVMNECYALIEKAPTQPRKIALGAMCTTDMWKNGLGSQYGLGYGCGNDGSILGKSFSKFAGCMAEQINSSMDDNGTVQLSISIPVVTGLADLFGVNIRIPAGSCSLTSTDTLNKLYCALTLTLNYLPGCMTSAAVSGGLDKVDACTTDSNTHVFTKGVRAGSDTGIIQSSSGVCGSIAEIFVEPNIVLIASAICGTAAGVYAGLTGGSEQSKKDMTAAAKILNIVNEGVGLYKVGKSLVEITDKINTITSLAGFDKDSLSGPDTIPTTSSGTTPPPPATPTASTPTPPPPSTPPTTPPPPPSTPPTTPPTPATTKPTAAPTPATPAAPKQVYGPPAPAPEYGPPTSAMPDKPTIASPKNTPPNITRGRTQTVGQPARQTSPPTLFDPRVGLQTEVMTGSPDVQIPAQPKLRSQTSPPVQVPRRGQPL